jgi:hypothetical protein
VRGLGIHSLQRKKEREQEVFITLGDTIIVNSGDDNTLLLNISMHGEVKEVLSCNEVRRSS